MIWTDCDREGEAIGYDVTDVCATNVEESNSKAPGTEAIMRKHEALGAQGGLGELPQRLDQV